MAPSHYSLLYQRARMLRATSRFGAAEDAFRVCMGSAARGYEGATPTYIAYAYNELGHMLSMIGRAEEAAGAEQSAI